MAKSKDNSLRTIVTFTCPAFKCIDEADDKPRFRGTFGDDLAVWLMLELETNGVDVVPGLNQADAGWYFTIRFGGKPHIVLARLRDTIGPVWQVSIERDVHGAAALFGGRRRGVRNSAASILHLVLSKSDKVANVRWHHERDINAGQEQKATLEPLPGLG